MVQQKIFSFNTIERGNQEVSPRGGLIVFDRFLKALKTEETIRRYMPLPGSNRGYEAWRYIEPLILMQYGGGRNISDLKELREDRVLQKATGMRGISFFRRQRMLYSGFNQFFKTKGDTIHDRCRPGCCSKGNNKCYPDFLMFQGVVCFDKGKFSGF